MAYTKVTGALVGSLSDLDLTNVGDIELDSITGDGDTNTSITFSGSDVITVTTGGETQLTFNNGSILPTTNNDVDLGSDALEFKNAWFDGTVETDNLTISGSQGSDGQVLTSTGSGVAWEAASSFNADAAQVFNESGNDVDFRVESNGNANRFFIDGGSNSGEGAVIIGHNASLGQHRVLQVSGTTPDTSGMELFKYSANNSGPVSYTHLTLPTNREV